MPRPWSKCTATTRPRWTGSSTPTVGPGVGLVGPAGCRAAWLVAQHAIATPALQRKFLRHLAQAVASGEAPRRQLAMLTDRIRFNEQRPQIYGTVLDWNERGELDCDVEDRAGLDARRAGVGLPPWADDLRRHRREVAREGGRPPADYSGHRRQRLRWAIRAGWVRGA